ncbi:hypothetical protein ACFQKF_20095 [Halalkalicoccus sp. GCM10025322]
MVPDIHQNIETIQNLPLSDRTTERILYQNAKELFGL